MNGHDLALAAIGGLMLIVGCLLVGTMGQITENLISTHDRGNTSENVLIIGVDVPSGGTFPSSDGIHYRVVLADGTLLRLSADDYFAVANQDLPVHCTVLFDEGGGAGTILSFDPGGWGVKNGRRCG